MAKFLNALSAFVPVLGAGAYFSASGARRPTCTCVVAKFPHECNKSFNFVNYSTIHKM